jgi:hypothetical protein
MAAMFLPNSIVWRCNREGFEGWSSLFATKVLQHLLIGWGLLLLAPVRMRR